MSENFEIELANGKLIKSSEVLKGCSLLLNDNSFNIDVLQIELGSFDIVVGMDWLSKNRAESICFEKLVRIPLANGETLVVHGEKSGAVLKIVNGMKAQKYLRKGYIAFLAHVVEKKH